MANQERQDMMKRIRSFRAQGQTGLQIATILHEEGTDLSLVHDAFYEEGYFVSIERLGNVPILHVSDNPMSPGLSVHIVSEEPQALPEIAWR